MMNKGLEVIEASRLFGIRRRPDAHRRASAVHRARLRRLHRWQREVAAGRAGHARCRSAMRWAIPNRLPRRSYRAQATATCSRCSGANTARPRCVTISRRPTRPASLAFGLPTRRSAAGGTHARRPLGRKRSRRRCVRRRRIAFGRIAEVIEATMNRVRPHEPTLAGYEEPIEEAREAAGEIVEAIERPDVVDSASRRHARRIREGRHLPGDALGADRASRARPLRLARRNGVRVNEFAVGLGPSCLAWTSPRSGTQYSLRALPIGGFCAMEGEDSRSPRPSSSAISRGGATRREQLSGEIALARLAIVLAGPVANFLLCYLILLVGALAFGVASDKANQPVVGEILPGRPRRSPASAPATASSQSTTCRSHRARAGRHDPCARSGKQLDLVYERNGVATKSTSRRAHVRRRSARSSAASASRRCRRTSASASRRGAAERRGVRRDRESDVRRASCCS